MVIYDNPLGGVEYKFERPKCKESKNKDGKTFSELLREVAKSSGDLNDYIYSMLRSGTYGKALRLRRTNQTLVASRISRREEIKSKSFKCLS